MATRTISTKLAIEGESAYRASLSRINSEIKTLQSALKLTKSEFQTNANSMDALTEKGKALTDLYGAQESKVRELQAALQNAREAEEKYSAQKASLIDRIEANNRALEELKNTTVDTSVEESRLNGENKELTEQLEKCDANLAAAERGVNSWQTQLNNAKIQLNDLDAELQLNEEYLNEARNSSDNCATSIDRFGDRVKDSAKQADALRDALAAAGVIAALKKTAEAIKSCVTSSIEFESAMAGVQKTTNLSQTELNEMASSIQELSTRIPVTTTEIASVVEAAGQLGIAEGDLLSFTEVMLNLGVSTNLSSTEAATALAKFANVVRMSHGDYEKLGSVIVALGNNFATTEADIVSMATRLSSTGAIVGLSEPQIMAIATALSSVGIEAEAGGSAISKLLKNFETMVATGSPKLEGFAAVAGMSAEDFAKAWGDDAVSALSLFIDGLGRIDEEGGSSIAVLDDLGIKEVRLSNAVMSLASSHGILERSLATADSAWQENTALAKEASTRYATTESKLAMLSNAFNNVEIAIGSKLTPSVGKLSTAGTEVLSWAADMISNSKLLVPIVTSVSVAIGVLASAVTGYTVVTKLATAAMGLFTAIMDANSIFLAVTAIAALSAGIAALVITLNDDAVPSISDLTTASSNLSGAFEAANTAYAESEAKILATTQAAKSYIDRLHELEQQGITTTEQQKEYKAIVEKLRYILPDVNISLDEQTGLLAGGTDALMEQVDAWKAVALQEALATKYQDQIDAWASAELEVYENQVKLNNAQADGRVLSERLSAAEERMTEIAEEQNRVLTDSSLTAEEQTAKYWELDDALYELYEDTISINREIKTNTKLQENLEEAIDSGTQTASAYEKQVEDAQAALESFAVSSGSAADNSGDLSMALEENEEAIQSVKDEITSLAQSYKDAYDSAYTSISGQIGLFDEFSASVSEDTNTVEKMMARWATQASNLSAYTENLKKASQFGLDDSLIASLSDGSAESAGYLATIIRQIEAFGGSAESMSEEANAFISEFNAAFTQTEEAKESFASTVAAIETDLSGGISRLEEAAADANFSGFSDSLRAAFDDIGVDFETIGINCGSGLSQGISSCSESVSGAASDMASDAIDAAKATLGCHSPSTIFHAIGENADTGLEQGIQSKTAAVIASVNAMGRQMTSQMQQSAKETVDAFDNEFFEIVKRTSESCTALVSSAVDSSSILPYSMNSIGVQAINGMINGLNNRSSALYATISGIVSMAILKAKDAADVHSPSKKTVEIFENVGEGMVVGLENKRENVSRAAQSVVDDALKIDLSDRVNEINSVVSSIMPQGIMNEMLDRYDMQQTSRSENMVTVNLNIERFENKSDRDLEEIAEYIEDRIQSQFDKKEAAF